MRAAVVRRYGPPEQVAVHEMPDPQPRRGEVLVRVEAAAVTAGDARIRAARFPPGFGVLARLALGLRGPRRPILGGALSGVVTEVGAGVEGLSVGDAVAGMNGVRMGAHAELVAVRAQSLVAKPAAVSHADAAGVLFGGSTARHFLRGRVAPGTTVLVNGASGAVGTSVVQLASLLGADVTAVCSAGNAALVTRLGATHVVDHTTTPVTSLSTTYDLVLDAVGNLTRTDGLRLAGGSGILVLAVAGLGDTVRSRGRVVAGPASERPEDLAFVLDLLARGQLDPVTEIVGGLEGTVEAHRRVDSGRKVGNLVVLPTS